MKAFAFLVPIVLALSSYPCHGQIIPSMVTSSTRILPNGEIEIRATYKMEPGPIPAFLGDPFSLKRVFQKNQVLADGTNIEKQTPAILHYQDSAGRFRGEYPFRRPANFPNRFDLPPQIEIIDSVAGYHYILDTVHRVAHRGVIEIIPRKPLPPPPKAPLPPPPSQTPGPGDDTRPQRSTEPLGDKVIDGLPLEGKRTTTTYPAGSDMGNDRPVTITSEEWASPGSAMPPFRKTNDPRSGEETAASYDIVRGEPDPSLFQIPADYRIVDEPGPFAITFIFSRDTRLIR
jgi:hypothetical protein